MLSVGRRISAGDYARSNIEAVFKWKTRGRGISRLRQNSDDEIADVLRLALNAKTARAANEPIAVFFRSTFPLFDHSDKGMDRRSGTISSGSF